MTDATPTARTVVYRPRSVYRPPTTLMCTPAADPPTVGSRVFVLYDGLRHATVTSSVPEMFSAEPDNTEVDSDALPTDLLDAIRTERHYDDTGGYCSICGAELAGGGNWGHDPRRDHVLWHARHNELPPSIEVIG